MSSEQRTLIVQLDVLGFNDLHPCEAARIVLGATGNRLIHAEWADNGFPGRRELSDYERGVVDTIDQATYLDGAEDWKVARLLEIIYQHLAPRDGS